MYVLYEVLSGEPVAAAWFEKRDAPHLRAWLEPYGELDLKVLATLSDGEGAEVAAMEAVWPGVPHQMCQVHFLGDIAKPIQEGDRRLRASLAESMGKLPPIPGDENTAQAKPKARTLELVMPPAESKLELSVDEEKMDSLAKDDGENPGSDDGGATSLVSLAVRGTDQEADEQVGEAVRRQEAEEKRLEVAVKSVTQRDIRGPLVASNQNEAAVQLKELERQFRAAFKDALHRPSRKPSTFGGLAGYDQLESLVTTLQSQLPKGATGLLPDLMGQGRRALRETRELAEDVRQAQGYLSQITRLLADPLKTDQLPGPISTNARDVDAGDPTAKRLVPRSHPSPAEKGVNPSQQVKQAMEAKLTVLEESSSNGPVCQAFLTNTRRLSTKWEDYLFHCYDIPGLPANNAALESLFGDLRRGQRRVSGRTETSALRRTGHFQILLRDSTMTKLWHRLRKVPLAAYQAAKERLEAAEEKQRWRYRLHRWPTKTAQAMITEHLGLRQQLNLAQPSGP